VFGFITRIGLNASYFKAVGTEAVIFEILDIGYENFHYSYNSPNSILLSSKVHSIF